MTPLSWRAAPELRLIALGAPLELLWELVQLPLYTIWQTHRTGYLLYALVHCTLGDVLILLVTYEVIALLTRNRRWLRKFPWLGGAAFTLLGVGYTIFSEILNVQIRSAWEYTNLMPRVPLLGIGAGPLLQWLLIPPLLVWRVRITEAGDDRQRHQEPFRD